MCGMGHEGEGPTFLRYLLPVNTPIAQWTVHWPTKSEMGVRFPLGVRSIRSRIDKGARAYQAKERRGHCESHGIAVQ